MTREGGDVRGFVEEVEKKARRLARARAERGSMLRGLAHVGVLGWTFILPVLGGAFLGHYLGARLGSRGVALGGIALGLCAGVYGVVRQLRRTFSKGGDP